MVGTSTKDTIRLTINNAKRLLARASSWTQKAYAKDRNGVHVNELSDRACKWCMLGALMAGASVACVGTRRDPVDIVQYLIAVLYEMLGGVHPADFNDRSKTTWTDIMRTYDELLTYLEV